MNISNIFTQNKIFQALNLKEEEIFSLSLQFFLPKISKILKEVFSKRNTNYHLASQNKTVREGSEMSYASHRQAVTLKQLLRLVPICQKYRQIQTKSLHW